MYGELTSVAGGLAAGVTAASANAAIFNDMTAMSQAGLFSGLPGSYDQIINWVIPEPSGTALLALGLGALALRRRRR
jgi:hypothetical protein